MRMSLGMCLTAKPIISVPRANVFTARVDT
jgi:hypothetical protein